MGYRNLIILQRRNDSPSSSPVPFPIKCWIEEFTVPNYGTRELLNYLSASFTFPAVIYRKVHILTDRFSFFFWVFMLNLGCYKDQSCTFTVEATSAAPATLLSVLGISSEPVFASKPCLGPWLVIISAGMAANHRQLHSNLFCTVSMLPFSGIKHLEATILLLFL